MKRKNLGKKITAAILAAALACVPLQAISVLAGQQGTEPAGEVSEAETVQANEPAGEIPESETVQANEPAGEVPESETVQANEPAAESQDEEAPLYSAARAGEIAGNTADTAAELPLNQEKIWALQPGNEGAYDYIRFTTTSSPDTFYTFTIENMSSGSGTPLDCEISKSPYFTDADKVGEGIYVLGDESSFTQNLERLEQSHTYYIRIKDTFANIEKETPYRLKVTTIEDDVKDSADKAKVFSVNKSISAALQNQVDIDVFTFKTPDTDSFYEFNFANQGEKAVVYSIYDNIELTDGAGDALPKNIYVGGKERPRAKDLKKLKRNQTYYVVVKIVEWETYGAPIPYTISVNSRLDDANNKVNNGDDKPANAAAIKAGTTVKKALQNLTDEDYFKFTVSGNENFYELTLKNYGNATINCGIWKKEGKADPIKMVGEPLRSGVAGTNADSSSNINLGLLKKGTYYIRIARNEEYTEFKATEQYSIKLITKKDDVKQIKSNMSSAQKLTLNKDYGFAVDNYEDEDYFQFKASSFKNHRLNFTNLGKGNLHITIYKTKYQTESGIILDRELYSDKNKKASITGDGAKLKLAEGKTYYIRITGDGGTKAKYRLGISVTPPTIKKPKAAPKKIKLSWSKVDKATGYIIYRSKTRDGKYKSIKTITKNSILTYTDKNLKKGKYFYKIRAYRKKNGKKEYSNYSNIQSQKL